MSILLLLTGGNPPGLVPLSPASASATGTLALKPRLAMTGSATCTGTLTLTAPTIPNINLYDGAPTSGGTDGTRISALNPIQPPPLLCGTGSTKETQIKLAVRAVSGKSRSGTFAIQIRGSGADRWALALDSSGSPGTWKNWGDTLYITGPIGATNKIFWAKARATTDETTSFDYPASTDHLSETAVVFRYPTDAA